MRAGHPAIKIHFIDYQGDIKQGVQFEPKPALEGGDGPAHRRIAYRHIYA